MNMRAFTPLLVILAATQCLATTCFNSMDIEWEPVDPADYDRTFSEITDEDARPLGYSVGYFNYNPDTAPCVIVRGTSNRLIELKVEAAPPATICARSGETEQCSQADGTITMCQDYTDEGSQASNSTRFEFFCNAECSESDVSFWYRFTISPGISADDDEQWCFQRDEDVPTDLMNLDFIPERRTTTTERSGAGLLTPSLAQLVAMLALELTLSVIYLS